MTSKEESEKKDQRKDQRLDKWNLTRTELEVRRKKEMDIEEGTETYGRYGRYEMLQVNQYKMNLESRLGVLTYKIDEWIVGVKRQVNRKI